MTPSRPLTPFYNPLTKDSFAIVPAGMKLLETKVGTEEKGAAGWFLKMGAVLDLDALCHPAKLVEQKHILIDDKIVPESLALRGMLFDLKNGKKHQYMQAPIPVPQQFTRSTADNADAPFLYGINFSSAIGQPHNPDAYYQISLVFDWRSGKIASGSKVRAAHGNLQGELSIIGYLLSGRLEVPEEIDLSGLDENAAADRINEAPGGIIADAVRGKFPTAIPKSVDLSDRLPPVTDQGDLNSGASHAMAATLEATPGFLHNTKTHRSL
jgi:hypothetical protein